MAHFYNTGELILARLFDPRYLYNSAEYVPFNWKVSLDNIDYSIIITDLLVEVDRYTGDRFVNRREDMIIQSAILIINQYKNLPLNQAEKYALTFKKNNDIIICRQEESTTR